MNVRQPSVSHLHSRIIVVRPYPLKYAILMPHIGNRNILNFWAERAIFPNEAEQNRGQSFSFVERSLSDRGNGAVRSEMRTNATIRKKKK